MKRISTLALALLGFALTSAVSAEPLVPKFKHLMGIKHKHLDQNQPVLVHVVPHSYNTDFLEAINEYFSDEKPQLMQAHFDKVFDSVFQSLFEERHRTFTHYEVQYFSNWYLRQTNETQQKIKQLFKDGTFEIVNGGWDIHDTVCPHYSDMLLNLQRGRQWLHEEFDYHPRASWSLDRNGQSDANARLFTEAGAEAIYLRYIDPQDRQMRMQHQEMEFIWRPNYQHIGRRAELFTHIIYDFDMSPLDLVIDEKIKDGQSQKSQYGMDVKGLREYINEVKRYYKTQHILMFVGSQENFEQADEQYYQLDSLIAEFGLNKDSDIYITYSTLSFYDETIQSYDYELPSNYFDMVPSTDNDIRYFTGLFTSRPQLKSEIRRASHVLHSANKLYAMKMIDPQSKNESLQVYMNASRQLQEIISVAQSADGVAGTSHKDRAEIIAKQLQQSINVNQNVTVGIINDAIMKYAGLELKKDS